MKKILFVNDEMTMGGVARILNTLLANLDQNEYQIDLLVLHHHGELLKEIPEGINVIAGTQFFDTIDLPLKKVLASKDKSLLKRKLRLLAYMKSGLINRKIKQERQKILTEKYDVEFSAKEGFCSIFVANGDSKLKLNWVQVDYKVSNYSINHMNLVKKALAKIDLNIACSKQTQESYQEVFGVNNVTTLHNLLDISRIKQLAKQDIDFPVDPEKFNLITVARFHHQKGVDRLLRVYALMLKNKANCSLTIIGDGELKPELEKLAQDLNIYEKITWLGLQKNPYQYMKKMDAFVMSSLYEGYPTIVIESLLCHLPVLTTEVAGVKEQILDDYYGMIVKNNEEAMYDGLMNWYHNLAKVRQYSKQLANYGYENKEILARLNKIFNGDFYE